MAAPAAVYCASGKPAPRPRPARCTTSAPALTSLRRGFRHERDAPLALGAFLQDDDSHGPHYPESVAVLDGERSLSGSKVPRFGVPQFHLGTRRCPFTGEPHCEGYSVAIYGAKRAVERGAGHRRRRGTRRPDGGARARRRARRARRRGARSDRRAHVDLSRRADRAVPCRARRRVHRRRAPGDPQALQRLDVPLVRVLERGFGTAIENRGRTRVFPSQSAMWRALRRHTQAGRQGLRATLDQRW